MVSQCLINAKMYIFLRGNFPCPRASPVSHMESDTLEKMFNLSIDSLKFVNNLFVKPLLYSHLDTNFDIFIKVGMELADLNDFLETYYEILILFDTNFQ